MLNACRTKGESRRESDIRHNRMCTGHLSPARVIPMPVLLWWEGLRRVSLPPEALVLNVRGMRLNNPHFLSDPTCSFKAYVQNTNWDKENKFFHNSNYDFFGFCVVCYQSTTWHKWNRPTGGFSSVKCATFAFWIRVCEGAVSKARSGGHANTKLQSFLTSIHPFVSAPSRSEEVFKKNLEPYWMGRSICPTPVASLQILGKCLSAATKTESTVWG